MMYDMFVDESRVKNFCSSSKKTRLRGLMYSCDSESHFGNRIISENIKNRVWSPIIHFHSVFDPFFEFRLGKALIYWWFLCFSMLTSEKFVIRSRRDMCIGTSALESVRCIFFREMFLPPSKCFYPLPHIVAQLKIVT